jgi:hypothetical protein
VPAGLDYKLQFLEMVVDNHMLVCWVELNNQSSAPFTRSSRCRIAAAAVVPAGLDYKLQFLEMVVDDHMAACWVDLNIKLGPFYIKRYHMPTIVMLRFRTCEDGL